MAVGSSEWIADTPEQYVDIARSLAQDAGRLIQLRSGLREQMRESRLCLAASYVKAIEAAYDEMMSNGK